MTLLVCIVCGIGILFSGIVLGMLFTAWMVIRKTRKLYCVIMTGLSVRGPSIIPVVATDPDDAVAVVRAKHKYGKIESIKMVAGKQLNVAVSDHWEGGPI